MAFSRRLITAEVTYWDLLPLTFTELLGLTTLTFTELST